MCTAQEGDSHQDSQNLPNYYEALHNNFMICPDNPQKQFSTINREMACTNNDNSHLHSQFQPDICNEKIGINESADDDMMGLAFCTNMSVSLDEGTYHFTYLRRG